LVRKSTKGEGFWISIGGAALFVILLIVSKNWVCPNDHAKSTGDDWQEELRRIEEIREGEEAIV